MFGITRFKASLELRHLYFLESKACFGRLKPTKGMRGYTVHEGLRSYDVF